MRSKAGSSPAFRQYVPSVADVVRMGLLCGIYVSAAKLGLSLDAVSGFATAVWPPTGIALVALVLYGYRLWPGIALGAFLANTSAGAPVLVASGMAVGNTLEAVVGTYLLQHVIGFQPSLARLRDVFGLVVLAAGLSTIVSATLGVTSGWLGGVIPSASFGQAWWTWWLGDAMGDLVVAPLLWIWCASPRPHLPGRQLAEAVALLLGIVAVSLFMFGGPWATGTMPYLYLLFPFLIWAAFRFGLHGAVTMVGLVSVIAIWGTVQGFGLFASQTLHQGLFELQAFMSSAAVMSLVLAAAITERWQIEEGLERQRRETIFLDQATQLFNSTLELDTVLQRVVQMATEVLGESCSTHLIEEGKAYLTPMATYHPDPQARQARLQIQRDDPVRIGDPASVMGLAAVSGRSYLVKDARRDGRVKYVDRLHISSLIVVPMIAKEKILGVLATSTTTPSRQFTEADLRLATALADRAALAIENARLYEQERVLRQTLEELNLQIQEVNRRKTDFVTLVSHELRTPLTSMTGFIALLLEGEGGPLSKRQREWLEIIGDNADRLVTLIDDLLDMARIEVGKIALKRAPLDLAPLIREVASALRPQLGGKGQWLTIDLAPALPAILGDADRLRQILTNLLSNAMKYTASGGRITITACGDTSHVHIAVRDTGIGLTPEDQAQLFTPFFRAQHDAIQDIGGTGLGLAITRVLVELHGGVITVNSVPGEGSTFSVTFPITQEPEEVAAGAELSSPS